MNNYSNEQTSETKTRLKLRIRVKIRPKIIITISYEGEELMKKTYKIDVDCANCANLMEEAIRKTPGIKEATVNFMALKVVVEFEEGTDAAAVMQDALKRVKDVEDEMEIFL